MRRASRSGITLIEVLIAVSLLGLISVGILTAMRVGLNALGATNRRLMENRRVAGARRVLEQQIAGFMPVIAHYLPAPEAAPAKMPFFQGETQSMRFVSAYSLGEAWRGRPQILEFHVVPGERGEGVRLIVNEQLYAGPLSAGFFCLGKFPDPMTGRNRPRFRPIEIGPASFVLADRLETCRFWYLEPMPPPAPERWRPDWVLEQWPLAIRIEMSPLRDVESQLRLFTLTAPVRVNRQPDLEYGDL